MKQNIEIKARISDPNDLMKKVAAIADFGPEYLSQEDIFFRTIIRDVLSCERWEVTRAN